MTSRTVPTLLLASLIAGAAFSTSAQTASISTGDAAVQGQQDENGSLAAGFDSNAEPRIDRHCLRQTGSRIVARANTTRARAASNRGGAQGRQCVAANGRVYSREDLERTGEVDIADALRKLDPAIH